MVDLGRDLVEARRFLRLEAFQLSFFKGTQRGRASFEGDAFRLKTTNQASTLKSHRAQSPVHAEIPRHGRQVETIAAIPAKPRVRKFGSESSGWENGLAQEALKPHERVAPKFQTRHQKFMAFRSPGRRKERPAGWRDGRFGFCDEPG